MKRSSPELGPRYHYCQHYLKCSHLIKIGASVSSVSGEGLGGFPSDLAPGRHAPPPPPPPMILPVFSPTLVHSFEILLRSKSVPSALNVYLWKFSRGIEAVPRPAILLGNLSFPPLPLLRGCWWRKSGLLAHSSPLCKGTLPEWHDSAFFSFAPYSAVVFTFLTPLYPCPWDHELAEHCIPEKKGLSLGVLTTCSYQCPASFLDVLPKFLKLRE